MFARAYSGALLAALVGAPFMLSSACKSSTGTNGTGTLGGTALPTPYTVVGQLDGGPPNTGLPALPELTNVFASEREDSVGIDFDPFTGATDYRVYPLPNAGDITVNKNGSLAIKGAVYRCAGLRQTNDLPNNTTNSLTNPDAGQMYENHYGPQYSWTAEIPANPTLGYVYVQPGEGLVPVYAVAVHPVAPEVGWRETRPKVYTTDTTLRTKLLGMGGRDDGIVFYVPSAAGSSTETLYHSETAIPVAGQDWTAYTEYYFTTADVASHQSDSTPPAEAFQILTAQAPGTQPLMAVFYKPGHNHTELSVGKERFTRASNQGPGPIWHLEWSGITGPTTLVVEALATGCPYQGFLAPSAIKAPPHQPLETLAQLQAASATGEVYMNGQYDLPDTTYTILIGQTGWGTSNADYPALQTPDSSPVPIARSFIQVTPQPHDPSAWDWYEGFSVGGDFGTSTATVASDPVSCMCQTKETPSTPCMVGAGACGYWTSPTFDIGAYYIDNPSNVPVFTYGQMMGQFWDAFDDWNQGVTSTLRFTVPQTATVDPDPTKFLQVTWSVNTVSTDRRYPQLIVSDQPSPIQDGFQNANANFLLVQTRIGPSMHLEAQAFHGLVNGKPWAVNNQDTTIHAIIDYDTWNGNFNGIPSSATSSPIPPADPPFEHAGMDRMTRYDAYISSAQLYIFMDGAPAGCMQYPTDGFALSGPVTVTFGDVLYHESAADELICAGQRPYPFMHEHQCSETKRQWDDLGFKSGVGPPKWDYVNYPCQTY